jgi:endo-1,4-beta-xylanase
MYRAALRVASVCVLALAPITAVAGQASAASTLGSLAAASGRYFGTALDAGRLSAGGAYTQLAGSEFNMVTPGNEMKVDATEPSRGTFSFGRADQIVAFAQAHNERVRGHTLVWHSQLPGWLTSGNFNATDLRSIMRNHIANVAGHYAGKLYSWDVVNEPFNEDGTRRSSIWQTTLGDGYIADALRAARAADPTAKLYINDFNIEGVNAKSTAMFNLAQSLLSQGVPLDGIGIQAHLILGQVPASMQQNMQRFANLGLDVAITELDVRMQTPADSNKLTQQANDYSAVTKDCLAVTRCVGITVWGIGEPDSWIPGTFPGQGAALLFDQNYQQRPAYAAVVTALGGATTTPPPTTPPPTTPPGTGCAVSYTANSWDTGFTTNIVITNTSSTAINGWTLGFSFPGNQLISNAWSSTPTQVGTAVTLANVSYNAAIPPGGNTSMGFQASYSGTNANPTAFTVNGTACTTG